MTLYHLLYGVWSEILKIKRSLALLSALLMPLLAAFVNFMMALRQGLGKPALGVTSQWSIYFMYSIKLWVIFMIPLVVAILSALLANVEHRSNAWKQLFAQPFPRTAILGGKWLVLAGIMLLSTLVFGAANLAGGILLYLIRPELGLGLPVPTLEAFARPLVAWMLSMFMMSIHLWISLRWSSFLVSVTIGFAAAISNIFLISSSLYTWSAISPWAMPAQAYDKWQMILIYSLVGAALVYLFTRHELVRREVY